MAFKTKNQLITDMSMGYQVRDFIDSVYTGVVPATDPSGGDDLLALQNEINAVPSGGTYYLPPKRWRLKTDLVLRSDIRIDGTGDASILDFSGAEPGSNGLSFQGTTLDNVHLSNFRIIGPSPDTGGGAADNGIFVRTTGDHTRIKIDNVTADNWGIGIYLDATNPGIGRKPEVTRCHINRCARAGLLIENARHGLVEGNYVDGDRTGVGDETDSDVNIWLPSVEPGDESQFMRVMNNTTMNGALESVILHTKFSTISGTTIENPGTAGLIIETAANATTKAHGELHNTVTGTVINGTSADGIIIRHDPANNTVAPGFNEVSDSVINGTGVAIRIGQAGATTQGPFDNGVNDNRCTNQTSFAISVDDAEGTTLDGNKVNESTGASIRVSGTSKRTIINGGYLNATGTDSDGVTIVETSTDTLINGVMFANCNRYGVRPSGSALNVVVGGNYFVDDQGVPTMNGAVAPSNVTQNTQVWGNFSRGTTDTEAYGNNVADPQAFQVGQLQVFAGTGTPESAVTANVGSLFLRDDGGASTSIYVKESGTGNTGWVAK